jgi:hypothetical protein
VPPKAEANVAAVGLVLVWPLLWGNLEFKNNMLKCLNMVIRMMVESGLKAMGMFA